MDNFIESYLKNFFDHRKDLFGEESSYLYFEEEQREHVLDGGGYNSNIVFGKIQYCLNGLQHSSPSFVLKLSLKRPMSYRFGFIPFKNEIQFFAVTLPVLHEQCDKLDSLFPKYYDGYSRMTSINDFRSIIMLEDLTENDGYKDQTTGLHLFLDYEHLSLMIKKLAFFHACSYRLKKKDELHLRALGDLFSTYQFTICERDEISVLITRGLRPLQSNPQYSDKIQRIVDIFENPLEFVLHLLTEEKNNRFSVLCHGDYLRHNVMVKYHRGRPVDMKMIDMATCKLASPVVDLALILYIHTDQSTRDKYWDKLINEYCTSLHDAYPDEDGILPTKKDIINELHVRSLYAYTIASSFVPYRWAIEHNTESFTDLLPEEYRELDFCDIPKHVRETAEEKVGGDTVTNILIDILKDIIDRGFAR